MSTRRGFRHAASKPTWSNTSTDAFVDLDDVPSITVWLNNRIGVLSFVNPDVKIVNEAVPPPPLLLLSLLSPPPTTTLMVWSKSCRCSISKPSDQLSSRTPPPFVIDMPTQQDVVNPASTPRRY